MLQLNNVKRTLKLNRILSLLTRCQCEQNRRVVYLEKLQPIYVNNLHNKFNSMQTALSVLTSTDCVTIRTYATEETETFDTAIFEAYCDETLDSLCEYFEDLAESNPLLKSADITFSDGVLTVNLGPKFGTYVINRQTPNKQIWLSSPISGPKRYDYFPKRDCWVYRHDNVSLHSLLEKEISSIIKEPVDLSHCAHCEKKN